ncbi:FAD-binding domain-containing protein [Aspergillus eucalypticola CBS 122712]|uniref:FAD-binding domain-containing protein n=1 Tax=Aspergillus eucalypticola (strain CBS 122712 / IBT 29274) TaxID=1448314 RepID=A0A317VJE1_ASPEC|nr:FAD-binding domain-containing protein [Aspergillus eucalypticola CBS 122712]PWY74045.1 FAD-binding domain-containing protein [Aspergillus eucalypticola CBS 122712]
MAAAVLNQLRSIFTDDSTDKVVINESADKYEAAVAYPWSQTCWTPAAAYVYLGNVQELTKALAIVQETGTKFAIRTTGHNPNAGFSSAGEAAVVLDIRQFRSKELLSDHGTARFGSGNTWGEVYHWLEERGLSAIGGRDSQVGLGGFLLGGGLGALPNLYGLGADGVKNFEVLLADGNLINANQNENSDLYRALKGGGSNFGIVTRFDLETHPLINVQYTINLYNPEDHVAINKATFEVQQTMEEDPKIGLFTNFNNGFVAVGLLYGDHPAESEAQKTFRPFHDLKSLMTTVLPSTNGTLLSLAQAMGHAQTPLKRSICTITTRNSPELYEEVYKTWVEPIGTAAVQAGKDRGENIMGHERWVFTCEWPKDGDDAAAQGAVNAMSVKVQCLAKERGLLLDYKCMTFATALQKVLGSYGAENIKRMHDVAAKYDPEGVFQKLQNDGFLLRNNV